MPVVRKVNQISGFCFAMAIQGPVRHTSGKEDEPDRIEEEGEY